MVATVDGLIKALVPSYGACIRSFYLNSTHAKAVSLTDLVRENSCSQEQVVRTAQRVTNSQAVQEVLGQPLVFQPDEIQEKNRVLQERGFTLLSTKPVMKIGFLGLEMEIKPYYNVSEHGDLEGWIIKSAARKIPEDQFLMGPMDAAYNEMVQFSPFESLQRLHMNRKFRHVAEQIEDVEVVVPEEYAIPFEPCHAEDPEDLMQTHFLISRKLDVLTTDETSEHIKAQSDEDQIKLAKAYIKLIRQGYCDSSFDSLRITRNGELAVLDTEPAGSLNGMHTIQKCTRVGLFILYTFSKQKIGANEAFTQEVRKAYLSSLKDISVKMVILSIFIPLIPIFILIYAFFLRLKIKSAASNIIDKQVKAQTTALSSGVPIDPKENARELKPFQDRYYQVVDGIPWKSPAFEQLIS